MGAVMPFEVLRRLDCILAPKKEAVRTAFEQFQVKASPDGPGLDGIELGAEYEGQV